MDYNEIRQWVEDNSKMMPEIIPFSAADLDHVAMCMEHILDWYYKKHDIGSFLTAVVRNDFRLACVKADLPNRKALYLYALFMYNKVPADYIKEV